MKKFYCQKCGAVVGREDSMCTSCGSVFSSVMCPKCNFSGKGTLFVNGCPKCGYLSEKKSKKRGRVGENSLNLKLFLSLFFLLIVVLIYLISIY